MSFDAGSIIGRLVLDKSSYSTTIAQADREARQFQTTGETLFAALLLRPMHWVSPSDQRSHSDWRRRHLLLRAWPAHCRQWLSRV
jgi:hypothetical protein